MAYIRQYQQIISIKEYTFVNKSIEYSTFSMDMNDVETSHSDGLIRWKAKKKDRIIQ